MFPDLAGDAGQIVVVQGDGHQLRQPGEGLAGYTLDFVVIQLQDSKDNTYMLLYKIASFFV